MTAADELSEFYTQDVAVETYLGDGSNGPSYAASATVACLVTRMTKTVRSADGEEVLSQATLSTLPANAAAFTVDSRVTLDGRACLVIAVAVSDAAGALDLPARCRVMLT